jgi:hypothetical protein
LPISSSLNRRGFLRSGTLGLTVLPRLFSREESSAIPIVVGAEADQFEVLAARELSSHLSSTYPTHWFPIVKDLPNGGACIIIDQSTLERHIGKSIG